MSILAVLLGIFVGAGVALFIVSNELKKSNDLGNNAAKYYDFADSFVRFSCRQNRVNRNHYRF